MEIELSRPEFFVLMVLARAEGIVGLDPDEILPEEPAKRQALYAQGEDRLTKRGLLRTNAAGEAELEQNLLNMVATITRPTHAIVSIKTLPQVGRQLFLYYGVNGAYVEQTLPTETSHRLASIGDGASLCRRLKEVFPLSASQNPNITFEMDGPALMNLYHLVMDGHTAEARATVVALRQSDTQAIEVFLADTDTQAFSGTIALMQVTPGMVNEASEFAVICSATANWLLVPGDAGKMRVATISAADFDRVLLSVLT